MTARVARLLFPLSLVVAVALWAKGYSAIGGGFSAGAVAGLGAVVQYVCLDHDHARRVVGARWVWQFVGFGLVGELVIMLGPAVFGLPPVSHFPAPHQPVTKLGTIELHTAIAFDLAVAVLVYGVFVGTFDRLFPPLKGDEP